MRSYKRSLFLCGLIIVLLTSTHAALAQDTTKRPPGWDEYSHGNDTDPVYNVVFPQDAVNTITIIISPDNWQAMQTDMINLFGEFGSRPNGRGGRPPGGGAPPNGGGDAGGVGGGDFSEDNPMWVPVDLTFNDQPWTKVGFRYKGNSTLSGAWGSGSLKLGFKLEFDQFEDDYPEIDNQRFYGFKEISFSSNFRDPSYLHEKVAADVFREAGIPAAQTAFYAVYMDYGSGSIYIGLYTAVEAIEDTVISTQFSDDSGNLYKPEGTGASFQQGTFDPDSFSKETNEDAADYSDVLALFEALHADNRTTDPAAWRTKLESVFNVDEFMHWLAVNTVIQNWDVYGTMAHNYYLYNDPATGQLTWIPWDNNEALTSMGGRRGSNTGALNQSGIGNTWPLIRYLIDDPVYHDLYIKYVKDTAENAFAPSKMDATLTKLHNLIAPYVVGDGAAQSADSALESADSFENSLIQLIAHVKQRFDAVQTYLQS